MAMPDAPSIRRQDPARTRVLRLLPIVDLAASRPDLEPPGSAATPDLDLAFLHSDLARVVHGIAVAMVHGPAAGLERVAALAGDPRLAGNHRVAAVRAHLLERAGDKAGAVAEYRRAAAQTASVAERNYLHLRASRLS